MYRGRPTGCDKGLFSIERGDTAIVNGAIYVLKAPIPAAGAPRRRRLPPVRGAAVRAVIRAAEEQGGGRTALLRPPRRS